MPDHDAPGKGDAQAGAGGGKIHIPPAPKRPLFLETQGTESGRPFVPSQFREGSPAYVRGRPRDDTRCASVTGECTARYMDLPGSGGPAEYQECRPGRCLLRRYQSAWDFHAALVTIGEERAKRADAIARDTNDGPPNWPERDDIGKEGVPF